MKKILSVILCLLLCFSITACGNGNADGNGASSGSDGNSSNSSSIGGDVEITLPAGWFEELVSDEDLDLAAYAKEQGFKSVSLNEDGSMACVMSKEKHSELLKELEETMEETFKEMTEDEDTPYIISIESNDDYTEFTVLMDKAGYNEAFFDLTPFTIGMQVMLYQIFVPSEEGTTINLVDADTMEVFSSTKYPDDLY